MYYICIHFYFYFIYVDLLYRKHDFIKFHNIESSFLFLLLGSSLLSVCVCECGLVCVCVSIGVVLVYK